MTSNTETVVTDLEAAAQEAEAAALVARQSARIDRERREREQYMAEIEASGAMPSYRAFHDVRKDLTRLNQLIAEAWRAFVETAHDPAGTFGAAVAAYGRWAELRLSAARRTVEAQQHELQWTSNRDRVERGLSAIQPWHRRYADVPFSEAVDLAVAEKFRIDEEEIRADPRSWQPESW